MAYHKSNLGKFAPEGHADLDGYIPQEGDKPEDFRFEHGVQESFEEDFDALGEMHPADNRGRRIAITFRE